VCRNLATAITNLSHYANWGAIEKILKERIGENIIQMADGISAQQWWIEVRL